MKDIIVQLGLNGWHMLFYVANLLILFAVLYGLLYRPVKKMIKKRKETLDAVYDENAKLNAEAQSIKKDFETKLETTREEVAKIGIEAAAAAENKAQVILGDAQILASAIIDNAKKEAAGEKERLTTEFRKSVGALSVEIASAVLVREVNPKDNAKLIDQALTQWEKN